MKRHNSGFALIGALVAASLATVLVTFVHKVGLRDAATKGPARPTLSSILSEQKMAQLRGLAFGFDDSGGLVSDEELSPSPAGALQQNTVGYVDYLDDRGVALAGSAAAHARTSYTRRWSIQPLSTDENSILIQVSVSPHKKRDIAQGPARLLIIRTRRAFPLQTQHHCQSGACDLSTLETQPLNSQ